MKYLRILYELWPLTWGQRWRWLRGLFNRAHSCGKKVPYHSKASACRAKEAMEKRTGRRFDIYTCFWCGWRHIGGSVIQG